MLRQGVTASAKPQAPTAGAQRACRLVFNSERLFKRLSPPLPPTSNAADAPPLVCCRCGVDKQRPMSADSNESPLDRASRCIDVPVACFFLRCVHLFVLARAPQLFAAAALRARRPSSKTTIGPICRDRGLNLCERASCLFLLVAWTVMSATSRRPHAADRSSYRLPTIRLLTHTQHDDRNLATTN